jgi:hypothetical protein
MHTLPIETFDSGATPKPGERRAEPKRMADVDLDAVRAQMNATIERAKADDPRELRKRIAELELETKKAVVPVPMVPAVSDSDRAELESIARDYSAVVAMVDALAKRLAKVTLRIGKEPVVLGKHIVTRPVRVPAVAPVARPSTSSSGEKLAGGERKILTALAQYEGGLNKRRLALLSGYAVGGGGFNNYLSSLRTRGLLDGRGEDMRITNAGVGALGSYEPLPTGEALRRYWLQQCGKAERAILSALFDAYPDALTKDEIAARAGYEAGGGGFNNALSRLRTLELIDGRGEIRASADLF